MHDNRPLLALGIDIGGSSAKWVLLEIAPGQAPMVRAEGLHEIPQSRLPDDVLSVIASITTAVEGEHGSVESMGIGIPGTFAPETGVALVLPNFPPLWRDFAFRDAVEARIGRGITLVNDAKAFCMAESVLGAGAGHAVVVGIVLGTGVGGGIVMRGEPLVGKGWAGELGHLVVELDGPLCGCGSRGCVEAFASASAICEQAGRESAYEVFAAARDGDAAAQAAIDRAIRALAAGIANVVVTLAPDVVVVGGGWVESGSQLIDPLTAAVRNRISVTPSEHIELRPSTLGRHAGAIGAALMSTRATQS